MKTLEEKEKFIELRARGLSYDKITKELHIAKQTAINMGKKFDEEIANLKAVELEALQEKYYLQRSQRIEAFGEKLKAIKDELEKRDLSESNISTEKLFLLFIKYYEILKSEVVTPKFSTDKEIEKRRMEKEIYSLAFGD